MNKTGNVRSQATKDKIYKALLYLLKHKKFNEIYVKDICEIACINRSSFYEHYQDINDLMMKVENGLSKQIEEIFSNAPYYDSDCFVKMFNFIKDNKEFYLAYVENNENTFMQQTDFVKFYNLNKNKLMRDDYKEDEIIYHMAFFSGGIKAICKAWLRSGLKESPQQMAQIVHKEYSKKAKFFN